MGLSFGGLWFFLQGQQALGNLLDVFALLGFETIDQFAADFFAQTHI
jgi:hypothetical protein